MPEKEQSTLNLEPRRYVGGIAIWGALPAVYDTTDSTLDSGIHVHARLEVGGKKVIDETFDVVRISLDKTDIKPEHFQITSEDATNYNLGTILKKNIKYLRCPECGAVHSDRGIYAVTYHKRHLCQECGANFSDSTPSISNPIALLKEIIGDADQNRPIAQVPERKLMVEQREFEHGIQVWGSNPAILWTSPKLEEAGIHVHGFRRFKEMRSIDETYGEVSIDGVKLSPEMVRYFMAQRAIPHLQEFIVSLKCPRCNAPHFDVSGLATVPHSLHFCHCCHTHFQASEDQDKTISNPLLDILEILRLNHTSR